MTKSTTVMPQQHPFKKTSVLSEDCFGSHVPVSQKLRHSLTGIRIAEPLIQSSRNEWLFHEFKSIALHLQEVGIRNTESNRALHFAQTLEMECEEKEHIEGSRAIRSLLFQNSEQAEPYLKAFEELWEIARSMFEAKYPGSVKTIPKSQTMLKALNPVIATKIQQDRKQMKKTASGGQSQKSALNRLKRGCNENIEASQVHTLRFYASVSKTLSHVLHRHGLNLSLKIEVGSSSTSAHQPVELDVQNASLKIPSSFMNKPWHQIESLCSWALAHLLAAEYQSQGMEVERSMAMAFDRLTLNPTFRNKSQNFSTLPLEWSHEKSALSDEEQSFSNASTNSLPLEAVRMKPRLLWPWPGLKKCSTKDH